MAVVGFGVGRKVNFGSVTIWKQKSIVACAVVFQGYKLISSEVSSNEPSSSTSTTSDGVVRKTFAIRILLFFVSPSGKVMKSCSFKSDIVFRSTYDCFINGRTVVANVDRYQTICIECYTVTRFLNINYD